jgi:hypothetical protein
MERLKERRNVSADAREVSLVCENRFCIVEARASADTRLRQGYAGQAVPPLPEVCEMRAG